MVYPVSQEDIGEVINLVVFHTRPELEGMVYDGPWTAQVDEASWLDEMTFDEWEPEARGWSKVNRCLSILSDPHHWLSFEVR